MIEGRRQRLDRGLHLLLQNYTYIIIIIILPAFFLFLVTVQHPVGLTSNVLQFQSVLCTEVVSRL